jgi:hypothetical protein
MKFQVGDLVRRDREWFEGKNSFEGVPSGQILQGIVVHIRPIPEDYTDSGYKDDAKSIVEVLWANSYSNMVCSYYDIDLILALEDINEGQK